MKKRRNDRGEITLAAALMGAWLLAILAGGATQSVLESKCDKEKATIQKQTLERCR